jgi:hypothetical protein
MTAFMQQMCNVQPQLNDKINKQEIKPYWDKMVNKLIESQRVFQVEWGAA